VDKEQPEEKHKTMYKALYVTHARTQTYYRMKMKMYNLNVNKCNYYYYIYSPTYT